MKKIIFLDVDGVLNRCGFSKQKLEPELLDMLKLVVDETGAEIVVSSTWRKYVQALEILEAELTKKGIKIIGCTPDMDELWEVPDVGGPRIPLFIAKARGHKIQAWMDANGTPDRFVIIDDNSDMEHLLSFLVKTDSFGGLTPNKAREAINLLNR